MNASPLAQTISRNLERCTDRLAQAAARSGRAGDSVTLLAVTKYVSPEVVRALYGAGVRDFGESRIQRAVGLAEELADLDAARWHMIGHLQRNKAKHAGMFHAIHSLDSERLALALERQLEASLSVYVEVNVAGEERKTGLSEELLEALLETLQTAGSHLNVVGLMTMAPHDPDPESSRPHFRRLRELRDTYQARGLLPVSAGLSMGMSNDFHVAVEEGATIVRVGSLLFEGTRPDSLIGAD